METTLIISDLRTLGIGWQYRGYKLIIHAVQRAAMNEDRLFAVREEIYIPIANHFSMDWRNIERNIRTVIHRAWQVNRDYLCKLAGYELQREPSVTQFLEMLTAHVLRGNHK